MNIDDVKQINSDLIKENNSVSSFKEQMFDFITGNFDTQKMMIISVDSSSLEYIEGIDTEKLITINPNKIIEIYTKHNLSLYDIAKMEEYLRESVMAFDSLTQESSRVVVLDKKDKDGNYIIAVCRTDAENVYINVNQLTSVYGKKNFEKFIERTFDAEKNFYCNEKTKEFFTIQGFQLPNEMKNSFLLSNYSGVINKSQYEKILQDTINGYGCIIGEHNYIIPYKESCIKINSAAELADMDIEVSDIGFNRENIENMFHLGSWTEKEWLDSEQLRWLDRNFASLDSISYEDTYKYLNGIKSVNVSKICNEMFENITFTTAQASMFLEGYFKPKDDDLKLVQDYVKDEVLKEYPDFGLTAVKKINDMQGKEIKECIISYIDSLENGTNIYIDELSGSAKEYFEMASQNRLAANVKQYIDSTIEAENIKVEVSDEFKSDLKKVLAAEKQESREDIKEYEKGEEI